MKNKFILICAVLLIGTFLLMSVSAADYLFQNKSGFNLTIIHGDTGNVTITGNVSAVAGFFQWIGNLVNRVTKLFVQDIDFTGNINGSGWINTTANISADYYFGDGSLLTGMNGTFNSAGWNRSGTDVYLAYTGDNVGIGTGSPDNKLHVLSSSEYTMGLRLETDSTQTAISNHPVAILKNLNDTNDNAAAIRFQDSGGNAVMQMGTIFTDHAGAGRFYIGDTTELLTILQSGNVGIGTASPREELVVVGNIVSESRIQINGSGVPAQRGWFELGHTGTYSFIESFLPAVTTYAPFHIVAKNFTIKTGTSPSTKVFVDMNGNVGIGTTSPSSPNIGAAPVFELSGAAPSIRLNDTTAGAGAADFEIVTVSGDLRVYDNEATSYRLSLQPDGDFIVNDGNVGIGTATPDAMLQLHGTLPYIRFTRTGVETWEIRNNYVGTEYGLSFFNVDDDATRFFVSTDAGKVGIGTTNPAYKLEVNGTLGVMGNGGLTISEPDGGSRLIINGSSGAAKGAYISFQKDNAQTMAIGHRSILLGGERSDMIFYSVADDFGFYGAAGWLTYINGTSGNVGIGTTSPGRPLDVIGTARAQLLVAEKEVASTDTIDNGLFISRTSTTQPGASGFGTGLTMFLERNSGAGSLEAGKIEALYEAILDTKMQFSTASNAVLSVQMTIDSDGNVGIGTSSPNKLLEVEGAGADIVINGTSSNPALYLSSNVQDWIIYQEKASGKLIFRDGTEPITSMVLENGTGNVGIGPVSPGPVNKLTVAGSVSIGVAYRDDVAPANGLIVTGAVGIGDPTPTNMLDVQGSMRVGAGYNNLAAPTNGMIIEGNVGIGTTSPSDKLDIQEGRILLSRDSSLLTDGSSFNSYEIKLEGFYDSDPTVGITASSVRTHLHTVANTDGTYYMGLNSIGGGTDNFVLNSAGNVGIGVTDPDTTLEVYKAGTQLKLSGGAADYATFAVAADGALTITTVDNTAAVGNIILAADGEVVISSELNMNTNKITNLVDPTEDQDAATKVYVDGLATGLNVKGPSRLATAAGLPAYVEAGGPGVGHTLTAQANNILTVDGVATALNDRILVKDEDNENDGIYKVTTEGEAGVKYVLTRATDADQDAECVAGMYTFITAGDTLVGSSWVQTNDVVVDTDTPTFVQFSFLTSFVEDDVYGAGWDADTVHSPSQNAMYDKVESLSLSNLATAPAGAVVFNSQSLTGVGSIVMDADGTIGVADNNPQITFDNANNWLEIAGSVGIGTATPGNPLDVEGNIGSYVAALYNSNANGDGLWIQSNGDAADEYPLYIRTDAIVPIMVVTGEGNVGIGTANPGAKLDIQDGNLRLMDTDASTVIEFKRTSDNWTPVIISQEYTGSYGGNLDFQLHPTDSIIGTAPVSVMYLKADATAGKVGIGTAIPLDNLHISSTDATVGLILERVDASITDGQAISILDTYGGEDGSESMVARINVAAEGDWTATSSATQIQFFVTPTNSVTSAGPSVTINQAGNVGIGTVTPFGNLEVKGTGANTIILRNPTESVAADVLGIRFTTGTSSITSANAIAGIEVDITQAHASSLKGELTFSVNVGDSFEEAMRIDDAKNVGIGTASPSSKITVNGNSATDGAFVILNGANFAWDFVRSGQDLQIGVRAAAASSAFTNVLTLDGDARNVGIGTVSPAVSLDVIGGGLSPLGNFRVTNTDTLGSTENDNLPIMQVVATDTGNDMINTIWALRDANGATWETARFHDALSVDTSFLTPGTDTRVWWERDPKHDIQSWGTAASTYMTINGGNVGIGTTTPGKKLDVAGVTRVTEGTANQYALLYEDGLHFTRTSDGSETGLIDFDGSDTITINSAGGSGAGANRIDFQVNSGSKMMIDNEGDVGIGTANPSSILHVNDPSGITTIYIGNYTDDTADDVIGYKIQTHTNDNVYVDTKTPTGGSLIYRIGEGAEVGATHVYMAVDPTNGYVGIGTTSPPSQLSINSSSTNNLVLRVSNSLGKIIGGFSEDADGDGLLTVRNKAGSVNVTLNSQGDSYFTGGDVGIGTTSPEKRLDIEGGAIQFSVLSPENDGNAAGVTYFDDKDHQVYVGPTASESGAHYYKVAEITSDNTASASYDGGLVSGVIYYGHVNRRGQPVYFSLEVNEAADQTNDMTHYLTTWGTDPSLVKVYHNTTGSLDKYLIYFYNGGAWNSFSGWLTVRGTSNVHTDVFATLPDQGASEPGGDLKVDTLNMNFMGKVGIGDTGPPELLNVKGANANIQIENTLAGSSGAPSLSRLQFMQSDGTSIGASIVSGDQLNSNSENDLGFWTRATGGGANSVKMTIEGSGNVGIGTASPGSLLQIGTNENGKENDLELFADGTGANANNSINFNMKVAGGNDKSAIGEISSLSFQNPGQHGQLIFKVGAWNNNDAVGTAKMVIQSDGTVGIGTTNPTHLLNIKGTTGALLNISGTVGEITTTSGARQLKLTGQPLGAAFTTATLSINAVNAGDSNRKLLGVGVVDVEKFSVDVEGDAYFAGALTAATINTGSGAMDLGDAAVANGDTNSIPTGDQVYDFVVARVPAGMIAMFNSACPTGWNIADGTSGTPNLANKFIRSEATAGNTGGSDNAVSVSHTHTFTGTALPAHQHANAGEHRHGIYPTTRGVSNNAYISRLGTTSDNRIWTENSGIHYHTSISAGTPAGTISTDGSSGTNANMPAYYSLVFCMKT